MVYLVMLAIAIFAMVAIRHCSGGDAESSGLTKSGGDTIDVAIEYSPLMCYTYADTLGGFNYDLIRMLAAQHNRAVKFHPVVTLQDALRYLEQGRVDMLVAQFPVTKENRNRLLFTDEVYIDRQVLLQRRLADGTVAVKTQLDLAGDTVYVVEGSPMKERILNLSNEIGDSIYVKEEPLYGPEQLFLQVAGGEIEYAVVNRRIAESLIGNYPAVDISTSISFSQIQAWALAKGSEKMLGEINQWLRGAKNTAQYKELLQRYGMQ